MSLGLTKPGASVVLRHPKTGTVIEPIGYVRGKAVWPVLGASSDDPDDPAFTEDEGDSSPRSRHEDDDDEEDEEDETEDDDDSNEDVKKKKSEDEPSRPERQAARYRVKLREAEKRAAELESRLRKIEDSDKPQDEILKRDLETANEKLGTLESTNRTLTAQLAFFKSNTVEWADSTDAFNLADKEGLFDDVIDEDGNVDAVELRRGLKDLAKRKPHLVKKSKARGQDEEDDSEQSSRSSAPSMNGKRRGSAGQKPNRAALAGRFPVLRSR